METTTTIPELNATPPTAFDKLLEAIYNGDMTTQKRIDVLNALADYIANR